MNSSKRTCSEILQVKSSAFPMKTKAKMHLLIFPFVLNLNSSQLRDICFEKSEYFSIGTPPLINFNIPKNEGKHALHY